MTLPVRQNAYLVANGTGTIFPTVIFNRAPGITDFNYPPTQRWIDTSSSNAEWFLLGFQSSVGVVSPNWVKISAGGLTAESLTGNSGGPVFPDVNFNINVVGDASGIQFAGNPGTNTLTGTLANIPNSSLAHSSITLVAGTGISISVSPVSLGGSTTIATTAALSAFNSIVVQTFPTTGVYTPSAGMKFCTIEVVGGGGGSGGCEATGASTFAVSGGGGGGGFARKTVTAATISGSQVVTIGAAGAAGAAGNNNGSTGGTSSVGVIVTASGGVGGLGGAASGGMTSSIGGNGGVGGSGDFNTHGAPGQSGILSTAAGSGFIAIGGMGGNSFFGGGAINSTVNAGPANAATSYGGGGGGAGSDVNTAARAGAAGFAGIVVITEYVSV